MSDLDTVNGWIVNEKIIPGQGLQQGDLIVFPEAKDMRKFGLVVTADCDLDKKKHARQVTLVPLVDLKCLVEHYLLIEQCDKQFNAIRTYACKKFDHEINLEDPVIAEELRLKSAEKSDDPGWRIPCIAVRSILNEIDSISISDYSELMKEIKVQIGDLNGKLASQIKDKGDLVVLPSLSSMGIFADVAWVRQIWQVPIRQIVMRNSEIVGDVGQRIARLDSPYRYRVTQVMGQVFSDIGMPDIKKNLVEDLGKAL